MSSNSHAIHFVSLGCARNLVDTEVMLGLTTTAGWTVVEDPADADTIVVNTCGFIDTAKAESVSTILEMADYKAVGRCETLVVTGCLFQRYTQELQKELPEVDYFLGTGEFPRIAEVLAERPPVRGFYRRPKFLYNDDTPRIHSGPAHSAYLKIAEGCSTRCAFCIIPKLRGPLRSRSEDSIVREAERLAAGGVRELNIIAQDSTDYGRDLNIENALPSLLRRLNQIDALHWIRVLYCYPDKVTSELIDTFASGDKLVPYIDMPVQHAHDETLRRMNRSVTGERIREVIEELREKIEGISIRTSVIVGFPGEDAVEFGRLHDFLESTRFDHVGVFKYSREEGTVANTLDGHVDEDIKEDRLQKLTTMLTRLSKARLEDYVGQQATVMIDGVHPESEHLFVGRLPTQAPEVDGHVAVARGPGLHDATLGRGDLVRVEITDAADFDLAGTAVAMEHSMGGEAA